MFCQRYEVVVTTHLNTDNIHNHLVVNSVSFKTGRKFENHVSDHYKLREISNLICKERGKSVLPPNKFKGSSKKEYWVKKNGGMTHRDMLRKDIDSIIKNSTTWNTFSANLKGLGYKIVKDDNYEHITIITDGWKRPVRLDSLGANYTIEAIERRLAYEDNVLGKISDDRFYRMSANYEKEQKELLVAVEHDELKVRDAEQEKINLNVFLNAIRECTDLKELTPTLVNTLIKRIDVHNSTKDEHGHKHVQIDIYFTAVGIINMQN